jgi:response regulator RpfG family c-di-GMP phosphodiesterase
MENRILFVDDDPNLLASYQRQLRKQFPIDTSLGAKEGLVAIKDHTPYAVVVSDLRMPEMNGIQFLSKVREITPDTVRIMLTGYADLQNAIEAVNEGNIFRFLTKPCHPDVLSKALSAGIEQYHLVKAEKELLEKTLKGSIKVLTELLALVNPEAFGRSSRIARYVREIGLHLGVSDLWKLETAAMLSQIGCVVLPEITLKKLYQDQRLTKEESQFLDMHPNIAADLLRNIPRMEEITESIAYQGKHFDGSGIPRDSRKGEDIPLAARILKAVLDFDMLQAKGTPKSEAIKELTQRIGWYDPAILGSLEAVLGIETRYEVREVNVSGLVEKMILDEDVRAEKGMLLITKGHEVSQALIQRLKNFSQASGIKEPIRVLVPNKV